MDEAANGRSSPDTAREGRHGCEARLGAILTREASSLRPEVPPVPRPRGRGRGGGIAAKLSEENLGGPQGMNTQVRRTNTSHETERKRLEAGGDPREGGRGGAAQLPPRQTHSGRRETQETHGGNVRPNRHCTRDAHREPKGARHRGTSVATLRPHAPKRAHLRERLFHTKFSMDMFMEKTVNFQQTLER